MKHKSTTLIEKAPRAGGHVADLAVSHRFLKQGVAQRKAAEKQLQKSRKHNAQLLAESRQLQQRLRELTHRIIAASEAERSKISRELHHEIAQTLLGINVRLLLLKKEAALHKADFITEIADTQRLVTQSIRSINRYAQKLNLQHAA